MFYQQKKVFTVLVSALLFVIFSQNILAKSLTEKEVERGMELWNIPALAVSVVTDDKVDFKKGFGKTKIKGGHKITEHTLFGIMSTTKAMVAAGILILVDQQKLQLDDLVIKHIPELHFKDNHLSQQITIRDLLAHRTGMPSTDIWAFLQKMPLNEQISKLTTVEASAPTGSRFIYQNTMYELAGEIIQRVSGKRWDHFLTDALWLPIGMQETYGTRQQIANHLKHVYPYFMVDGKLKDTAWNFDDDEANAAGSVWSSIHDMSLWAQFLLNNGKTANGKQLITPASIAEMFEPQMIVGKSEFYPTTQLTNPKWTTYGLGWFQQDFQGRKIDFHTGSLSGLIAIIGLDRKNNKAMVVLGNLDHAEVRHALLWHVMDNQTGADSIDWNQSVFDLYQKQKVESKQREKKAKESRQAEKLHALPLEQYAGTYSNESFGNMQVVLKNNQLILKSGRLDFSLSHWHYDTFEMKSKTLHFSASLNFNLGSNGKVQSMQFFGLDFEKASD